MSSSSSRLLFASLCLLWATASCQRVSTKHHLHNTTVESVLTTHLRLPDVLKSSLQLSVPATFETQFLESRYKFKNRDLLLKALLHGGYRAKDRNQRTDSYEPLDQIGTVVLDYLIGRHLFLNLAPLEPKQFGTMKSALLKHDTLAFLALTKGLDEFVKAEARILNETHLANFKKAVTGLDSYQRLVEAFPDSKQRPTPGSLIHRIFKAVIGAVYVDSGYNIQTADDVFMPMFKKEIDTVVNKVTLRKQPVV